MVPNRSTAGDDSGTETSGRETGDKQSLLGRRSCLKVAGATLAAAGWVTRASTLSRAAEYRTITVPGGSTESISIGSGETFENVLIDQSAPGASARIVPSGSDWTIRNVGFKGPCGGEPNTGGDFFQILPHVGSGSTGVIENVYLPGTEYVSGDIGYGGGFWVQDEHAGTLTVRNCYMSNYANNGLYASSPGNVEHSNGNGPTHVENSYFENNCISNVRLGTPDSYLKDSVVYVDGDGPANPNGANYRGVWGWYNPVVMENSDVMQKTSNLAIIGGFHGGYLEAVDCRYQGSISGDVRGASVGTPVVEIPSGVPTDPVEAASGQAGGGSPDLPNKIVIDGTSTPNQAATYSFDVSGEVEKSAELGSINGHDTISGGTVEGRVIGGTDAYVFSGNITRFESTGDLTVKVQDNDD